MHRFLCVLIVWGKHRRTRRNAPGINGKFKFASQVDIHERKETRFRPCSPTYNPLQMVMVSSINDAIYSVHSVTQRASRYLILGEFLRIWLEGN